MSDQETARTGQQTPEKREQRQDYYITIPAAVRKDTRLTSTEKLLLGEILLLSASTGECYASNAYFAKIYGRGISSISHSFTKLANLGYIRVEMNKADGRRYLKLVDEFVISVSQKTEPPIDENVNTPSKNLPGPLQTITTPLVNNCNTPSKNLLPPLQNSATPIVKNCITPSKNLPDPLAKNCKQNIQDNKINNIQEIPPIVPQGGQADTEGQNIGQGKMDKLDEYRAGSLTAGTEERELFWDTPRSERPIGNQAVRPDTTLIRQAGSGNQPIGAKAKRAKETDSQRGQAFAEFWQAYPRKVKKEAAKKAFAKLKPSSELVAQMLDAIRKAEQSSQWQRDNGQYIPHPATWLNNRQWEDEIEVTNNAIHRGGIAKGDRTNPAEQWKFKGLVE